MSRRNQRPPKRRSFSRRQFLQTAAGAATVPVLAACGVSVPLAPGSADAAGAPAASGPMSAAFQHGIASGDPLADRVVLWTRVTQTPAADVSVEWVMALDPALTQVVAQGSTPAASARDYTAKVDVAGLAPGTTYYYRFGLPDGFSQLGRTRTLPADGVSHLRIATVTCSDAGSTFNAYARVAERADLDLVIHLGDYIYADADLALENYRTEHRSYKASNPELREMHRQHPMISIWDDHETCNDAYQNGAPPPNPTTGPAWDARKGWATQAYFEWLPIRENADGSRRIYRSFELGGLLDLVMLDTRLEGRDAQVSGETDPARSDPARHMMSAVQEDWCAQQLRGSAARWRMLGNQVMLGHLNEVSSGGTSTNNWMDQWDGYPPARQRLYDVLKGDASTAAVKNVVVVTGDWHNSFILDLPEDPLKTYDGATGAGALAVEFITPSVTSGFFSVSDLSQFSPHIKHHNDQKHGYHLFDIKADRIVGEEWQVDTVDASSTVEALAVAFEVRDGENRLRPYTAGATPAKPSPDLAP